MSVIQCDFTDLYCPDFMPAIKKVVRDNAIGAMIHCATKERSSVSDLAKYESFIKAVNIKAYVKQEGIHHFMLEVL